jgi:hypothetical protein
MSSNTIESRRKPEKVSSKDEPKTIVSTIGYGLKVRITEFSDGSQTCDVCDVTVDDPKTLTPEVPVAAPQKDTPMAAVPATPVAAAPRELPDDKAKECSVCKALADALREQAKAAAPRRRFPPREPPQRITRS